MTDRKSEPAGDVAAQDAAMLISLAEVRAALRSRFNIRATHRELLHLVARKVLPAVFVGGAGYRVEARLLPEIPVLLSPAIKLPGIAA